jgi:predicted dithiol-disulfide oxidoreductase (DUF899 family)
MAPRKQADIAKHPVVSHAKWLAARKKLLVKEKAFSHRREDLARQRRALPWEKVEKNYVFEGPDGSQKLAELFGSRSQLVVYHFMFAPEATAGCPHCSFWADHYDGMQLHLPQRDVSFAVVSRAPLSRILPFKKRMGWSFTWVSSAGSDFNYDFQASFEPKGGKVFYNYQTVAMDMKDREGISVFYKDPGGAIYHTYSCYARGIDMVNGTYQFLDLVPKGRDEDKLDFTQAWVRHHDRYEA